MSDEDEIKDVGDNKIIEIDEDVVVDDTIVDPLLEADPLLGGTEEEDEEGLDIEPMDDEDDF